MKTFSQVVLSRIVDLLKYTFWANTGHSQTLWLADSSALLRNLHFEQTVCFPTLLLLHWLAMTGPGPLLTILLSPSYKFFFNQVQERLLVTPSACLKNWTCNGFSFPSAIPSLFLCDLYCKGSHSALGFKMWQVAFSSIFWLCGTYWFKLNCSKVTIRCTNQPSSIFLPRQVVSTCICSKV